MKPDLFIRWWVPEDRETLRRMQNDPDYIPAARLVNVAPNQIGLYRGQMVFVRQRRGDTITVGPWVTPGEDLLKEYDRG
jgi:hypothetical protein